MQDRISEEASQSSERRAALRFPLHMTGSLGSVVGPSVIEAEVVVWEISCSGMLGMTSTLWPLGSVMEYRLNWPEEGPGQSAVLCCRGAVLCHREVDGNVGVVARFGSPPTLIERFLSPQEAFRQPCSGKVPGLFRLNQAHSPAFSEYGQLRTLLKFAKSHPQEAMPLKRAARIAGMESSYFSAFFHAKVGQTYGNWRSELRVLHAMEYLRRSEPQVSEIADLVGFSSIRTFERSFKVLTGLAPSAFRKLASSSRLTELL